MTLGVEAFVKGMEEGKLAQVLAQESQHELLHLNDPQSEKTGLWSKSRAHFFQLEILESQDLVGIKGPR